MDNFESFWVGYQRPESTSLTLKLTVAIDNPMNSQKLIISLSEERCSKLYFLHSWQQGPQITWSCDDWKRFLLKRDGSQSVASIWDTSFVVMMSCMKNDFLYSSHLKLKTKTGCICHLTKKKSANKTKTKLPSGKLREIDVFKW